MVGWQRWGHQLVWMGWQSIQTVGVFACVIFILHQKILKMAKCTFWYQLTRVVPDKVQRAVKWLCALWVLNMTDLIFCCVWWPFQMAAGKTSHWLWSFGNPLLESCLKGCHFLYVIVIHSLEPLPEPKDANLLVTIWDWIDHSTWWVYQYGGLAVCLVWLWL